MCRTVDNLRRVVDLIGGAIECVRIAKTITPAPELIVELQSSIREAHSILEEEEMEVIRFGDLTRTADQNYQPYASIKYANSVLQNLVTPKSFIGNDDQWGEVADRLEAAYENMKQLQFL